MPGKELATIDARFDRYVQPLTARPSDIARDLVKRDSDIYAFSCYVWNTGTIRRVVTSLLEANRRAEIVLGGPQVVKMARRYLDPRKERLLLCNGEGEPIFRNYLLAHSDDRDYTRVRGLSFYRDGELIVTPDEPRLGALDEIPSPFLEGYIESHTYATTVLETNRGCPYPCTFCYWGNKLGNKLYAFNEDRVRAEIEWIARNGIINVYIGDANWGILERDVRLTQWIAECHDKYGMPMFVQAPSAKKKGSRVAEIGKIFLSGGLSSAQALAMQSTNMRALETVRRADIGLKVYMETQQEMNAANVDTYVELIWPLPGETLESFKSGIADLCRKGASSFHVFPLLLLPNTEMETQRENLELKVVQTDDEIGEYEVVVGTRQVNEEIYEDGLWYAASVLMLHNARCLPILTAYLDSEHIATYESVFSAFATFCRDRATAPWSRFNRTAFSELKHVEFAYEGKVAHMILYSEREAFDTFLHEFVRSQPWGRDEKAQFCLEIDLLNAALASAEASEFCRSRRADDELVGKGWDDLRSERGRIQSLRCRNDDMARMRKRSERVAEHRP